MKFINKKIIKWTVVLLSLLFFIYILRQVFKDNIIVMDNDFYFFLVRYSSRSLNQFFKFITIFGGAEVIITITLVSLFVIKEKKYSIAILVNLFIVVIANNVLKNIIARPRPSDYSLITEIGYSFPSGHSMVSLAFYGLIIYFIYKNFRNESLKYLLCVCLSLLIMMIGLSRIYLRVHYLSDVMGGFLITIPYLILYITIWKYITNKRVEGCTDEIT